MQSIFCTEEPCQKCGRCCKSFFTEIGMTPEEDNSVRRKIYETSGIIYPHKVMMKLCVTPEELEVMKQEALKKGINLKFIPNKVVYNKEKDSVVVIDYILEHEQCPFIAENNLCTIYEKRPRVCKQFPKIENTAEDIKNKIKNMGINPNSEDYNSALKRAKELC